MEVERLPHYSRVLDLVRAALRGSWNLHDVDDALQDAVVSWLEMDQPANDEDRMVAFLVVAARNRLLDEYRRAGTRERAVNAVSDALYSSQEDADVVLEGSEIENLYHWISTEAEPREYRDRAAEAYRELIAVLNEELDDKQWIYVRLVFQQRFSQRQQLAAHELLNVSRGTISAWQKKVQRIVRFVLEKHGFDPDALRNL